MIYIYIYIYIYVCTTARSNTRRVVGSNGNVHMRQVRQTDTFRAPAELKYAMANSLPIYLYIQIRLIIIRCAHPRFLCASWKQRLAAPFVPVMPRTENRKASLASGTVELGAKATDGGGTWSPRKPKVEKPKAEKPKAGPTDKLPTKTGRAVVVAVGAAGGRSRTWC